ncbi:MAG TPA: ATP-binding protein [Planktothrix sp.]|jgi:PAS domain S-box-containing protein
MKISFAHRTSAAVVLSTVALIVIAGMIEHEADLQMSASKVVNNVQMIVQTLDNLWEDLGQLVNTESAYFMQKSNPSLRDQYKLDAERVQSDIYLIRQSHMAPVLTTERDALCDKVLQRLNLGKALLASDRSSVNFQSEQETYARESRAQFSAVRHSLDILKAYERDLASNSIIEIEQNIRGNITFTHFLVLLVFLLLVSESSFAVKYVAEKQRSEDLLRSIHAIVDTAPDGIITIGQGGKIESANSAVQSIFDYLPEELLGKPVETIIDGFFEKAAAEIFASDLTAIESKILFKDRELTGRRKGGDSVPIELAASLLSLGDRRILTAIVRDITDRKEAEARVSEFYATVSHELRTPLTSIRTAFGLLETSAVGKFSSKGKQLVRIGRSECDRLIRLINDILDIRKIEAGKLALKLQNTQPASIINITFNSLRNTAKQSGVKLDSEINCSDEMLCDVDRIVQVLTNLVSNAIRFAPGDSTVLVRVEPRSNDGKEYIRCWVIDEGSGIPEDQLPKVWDRFLQLEGPQAKPEGGSGLGLAISKAIVGQHGGTVGVQSKANQGCKFWFELPTHISEMPNESSKPVSTGRRILVIDDDDEVADLLNGLLSYGSYEFMRASSIAEARRYINDGRPDIVLLDLRLPDGNGFDLVGTLVSAKNESSLPFIVLPERDLKLHTLGNPVLLDWLIQPFDEDYLRRSLELALSRPTVAGAKFVLFTGTKEGHQALATKLVDLNMQCLNQHDDEVSAQIIHSLGPDMIILETSATQQLSLDVLQLLRQEHVRPIPLIIYAESKLAAEDIDKLTLAFARHVGNLYMTEPEFLGTLRRLLDSRLRQFDAQPVKATAELEV